MYKENEIESNIEGLYEKKLMKKTKWYKKSSEDRDLEAIVEKFNITEMDMLTALYYFKEEAKTYINNEKISKKSDLYTFLKGLIVDKILDVVEKLKNDYLYAVNIPKFLLYNDVIRNTIKYKAEQIRRKFNWDCKVLDEIFGEKKLRKIYGQYLKDLEAIYEYWKGNDKFRDEAIKYLSNFIKDSLVVYWEVIRRNRRDIDDKSIRSAVFEKVLKNIYNGSLNFQIYNCLTEEEKKDKRVVSEIDAFLLDARNYSMATINDTFELIEECFPEKINDKRVYSLSKDATIILLRNKEFSIFHDYVPEKIKEDKEVREFILGMLSDETKKRVDLFTTNSRDFKNIIRCLTEEEKKSDRVLAMLQPLIDYIKDGIKKFGNFTSYEKLPDFLKENKQIREEIINRAIWEMNKNPGIELTNVSFSAYRRLSLEELDSEKILNALKAMVIKELEELYIMNAYVVLPRKLKKDPRIREALIKFVKHEIELGNKQFLSYLKDEERKLLESSEIKVASASVKEEITEENQKNIEKIIEKFIEKFNITEFHILTLLYFFKDSLNPEYKNKAELYDDLKNLLKGYINNIKNKIEYDQDYLFFANVPDFILNIEEVKELIKLMSRTIRTDFVYMEYGKKCAQDIFKNNKLKKVYRPYLKDIETILKYLEGDISLRENAIEYISNLLINFDGLNPYRMLLENSKNKDDINDPRIRESLLKVILERIKQFTIVPDAFAYLNEAERKSKEITKAMRSYMIRVSNYASEKIINTIELLNLNVGNKGVLSIGISSLLYSLPINNADLNRLLDPEILNSEEFREELLRLFKRTTDASEFSTLFYYLTNEERQSEEVSKIISPIINNMSKEIADGYFANFYDSNFNWARNMKEIREAIVKKAIDELNVNSYVNMNGKSNLYPGFFALYPSERETKEISNALKNKIIRELKNDYSYNLNMLTDNERNDPAIKKELERIDKKAKILKADSKTKIIKISNDNISNVDYLINKFNIEESSVLSMIYIFDDYINDMEPDFIRSLEYKNLIQTLNSLYNNYVRALKKDLQGNLNRSLKTLARIPSFLMYDKEIKESISYVLDSAKKEILQCDLVPLKYLNENKNTRKLLIKYEEILYKIYDFMFKGKEEYREEIYYLAAKEIEEFGNFGLFFMLEDNGNSVASDPVIRKAIFDYNIKAFKEIEIEVPEGTTTFMPRYNLLTEEEKKNKELRGAVFEYAVRSFKNGNFEYYNDLTEEEKKTQYVIDAYTIALSDEISKAFRESSYALDGLFKNFNHPEDIISSYMVQRSILAVLIEKITYMCADVQSEETLYSDPLYTNLLNKNNDALRIKILNLNENFIYDAEDNIKFIHYNLLNEEDKKNKNLRKAIFQTNCELLRMGNYNFYIYLTEEEKQSKEIKDSIEKGENKNYISYKEKLIMENKRILDIAKEILEANNDELIISKLNSLSKEELESNVIQVPVIEKAVQEIQNFTKNTEESLIYINYLTEKSKYSYRLRQALFYNCYRLLGNTSLIYKGFYLYRLLLEDQKKNADLRDRLFDAVLKELQKGKIDNYVLLNDEEREDSEVKKIINKNIKTGSSNSGNVSEDKSFAEKLVEKLNTTDYALINKIFICNKELESDKESDMNLLDIDLNKRYNFAERSIVGEQLIKEVIEYEFNEKIEYFIVEINKHYSNAVNVPKILRNHTRIEKEIRNKAIIIRKAVYERDVGIIHKVIGDKKLREIYAKYLPDLVALYGILSGKGDKNVDEGLKVVCDQIMKGNLKVYESLWSENHKNNPKVREAIIKKLGELSTEDPIKFSYFFAALNVDELDRKEVKDALRFKVIDCISTRGLVFTYFNLLRFDEKDMKVTRETLYKYIVYNFYTLSEGELEKLNSILTEEEMNSGKMNELLIENSINYLRSSDLVVDRYKFIDLLTEKQKKDPRVIGALNDIGPRTKDNEKQSYSRNWFQKFSSDSEKEVTEILNKVKTKIEDSKEYKIERDKFSDYLIEKFDIFEVDLMFFVKFFDMYQFKNSINTKMDIIKITRQLYDKYINDKISNIKKSVISISNIPNAFMGDSRIIKAVKDSIKNLIALYSENANMPTYFAITLLNTILNKSKNYKNYKLIEKEIIELRRIVISNMIMRIEEQQDFTSYAIIKNSPSLKLTEEEEKRFSEAFEKSIDKVIKYLEEETYPTSYFNMLHVDYQNNPKVREKYIEKTLKIFSYGDPDEDPLNVIAISDLWYELKDFARDNEEVKKYYKKYILFHFKNSNRKFLDIIKNYNKPLSNYSKSNAIFTPSVVYPEILKSDYLVEKTYISNDPEIVNEFFMNVELLMQLENKIGRKITFLNDAKEVYKSLKQENKNADK